MFLVIRSRVAMVGIAALSGAAKTAECTGNLPTITVKQVGGSPELGEAKLLSGSSELCGENL